MIQRLNQALTPAAREIPALTISLGMVTATAAGTLREALHNADQAMYEHKQRRKLSQASG